MRARDIKKALERIIEAANSVNHRSDAPMEQSAPYLLGKIQSIAEQALGIPYVPKPRATEHVVRAD